jgi:autotransporter-associated beta strand protein/T5SS/PEP-CTERM-associated repeat protein
MNPPLGRVKHVNAGAVLNKPQVEIASSSAQTPQRKLLPDLYASPDLEAALPVWGNREVALPTCGFVPGNCRPLGRELRNHNPKTYVKTTKSLPIEKGHAALLLLALAALTAQAASINVTNASFETPSMVGVAPYYTNFPADDGVLVGTWVSYGGGFAAEVVGGAYGVSPAGLDGHQFGDQTEFAGSGVFQDTAPYDGSGDTNLYWQAGYTYTLTVGFFTRSDNPIQFPADEITMHLFYRTSRSGPPVLLGTQRVFGSGVTTNALTDFSVSATVRQGDPSIGYPIGIWFTPETGNGHGDWGYDNVRLTGVPAAPPPSGGLVLTNGDASPQLTLDPANVVAALHFGNDNTTYTLQGVDFANSDNGGFPGSPYFSVDWVPGVGFAGDGFKAGYPTLGTGDTNDQALASICNSFWFGSDAAGGFNYTIPGLAPYSTNQVEFIHYIGTYGPRGTVISINGLGSTLSQTNLEVNGSPLNTRFSGIVADGTGSITGRFQGLTDGAWISAVIVTFQGQGLVPVYTWTGKSNGDWDINTTTNWVLSLSGSPGTPAVWTDGVITRFDDTAKGTTTVNAITNLAPGSLTVSNNSASYTFTGPGSITGAPLLKQGTGTLTVASANTFGPGVASQVQAGAVVLAAPTTVNGELWVGCTTNSGASLILSNAALNIGSWLRVGRGNGTVGNTASVSLYNSTLSAADLSSGNDNGIAGNNAIQTLDLNSGDQVNVAGTVYLGESAGSTTTVNQSGGTFTGGSGNTYEFQIGQSGSSAWNQSGGTNYGGGWVSIGRNAGANGSLNVSGGTFNQTLADHALLVGEGGTGTLTISGSGLVTAASTSYGVLVGWDSTGIGTVNLNGGTLMAQLIQGGQGSGTFNFNGGTLKAGPAANSNFMSFVSTANVLSGGAIIDTDTNRITIVQTLNEGGGGGLTKLGSGALVLTAANTYSGLTVVSNGTLLVDGSIAGNALVASGGALGGTGTISGAVTVNPGGALSPGDGLGTLTLNASPVLNGATVMEVSKDGGTAASDLLVVAGSPLTYGGTLQINPIGTNALHVGDTFTLFNAPSIGGAFASVVTYSAGQLVTWTVNSPGPGQFTVASVTPVSSPSIGAVVSGTNLTISWPEANAGWRLLQQTNHLDLGISRDPLDWGAVAGSQTNHQVTVPVSPANPTEFYRLTFP